LIPLSNKKMNIFFNKQKSEPSQPVHFETRYEKILRLLGEKKFSLGFKDTYIISADNLVKCDVKPFWGQRAQDEIHINTISRGIETSNGLFHPIILAHIVSKEEFSIFDGQHRYEALMRLSDTQRKNVMVQVDVINFELEDTKWILKHYEWINTTKGVSKIDLDTENKISIFVDECSKHFGVLGGKYKKIDEFTNIKNKQNSKLLKSEFKKELLKRIDRLGDNPLQKIIEYNEKCCVDYEKKFKGLRVGKNVKEECVERKFWLGVNFPQWLDEIF